jgi:DNA modification methylase
VDEAYENRVLLGKCLEVLRELPDECLDACVTDPPYGLGTKEPTVKQLIAFLKGADLDTGGDFMGAKWEIPSVLVWREVYRVLKPGAHVLSFGGTRAWDLISMGLRAAGFEYRDTIADEFAALQWIHGQGFPKSLNVSKAIDEEAGAEREVVGVGATRTGKSHLETTPTYSARKYSGKGASEDGFLEITAPATAEAKVWSGWGTGIKPAWEPILVFRKPLEGKVIDNVREHGTGAINIDATRVRHASPEDFAQHKAQVEAVKAKGGVREGSWKNSSDLSGANDVTEAGRWPSNLVLAHAPGCKRVGTKSVQLDGSGIAQEANTSTLALGSGSVYGKMPHLDRAVGYATEKGAETVENWKCVEGCPVRELDEQSGDRPSTLTGRADPSKAQPHPGKEMNPNSTFLGERTHHSDVYADSGGASRFFPQFEGDEPGEWECVEGCPIKELDEQSGDLPPTRLRIHPDRETTAHEGYTRPNASSYTHKKAGQIQSLPASGGASRFFPSFPGQEPVEVPFKYVAKPSKRETHLDGLVHNDHPTKKPVELMKWLVRLACPKGGIVLDPYCGSGSTLHAACEEEMLYVGIDEDPHAVEIATARMDIVSGREQERKDQMSAFDLAMGLGDDAD